MEDIPKYRKKSQKKPPKKANHKHEWANCVYNTMTYGYSREKGFYKTTELSVGTYCPICGKIGNVADQKYRENICAIPKFYQLEWTKEAQKEFDPATRTLPFFEINQFKDKFVMTTASSNGSHI